MTHVHLVGIGGTGLSAIARVLLESGYTVSGSDRDPSPLADSLAAAGATVYAGHDAANIAGADIVVRSSAVRDDNPEVLAARAAGIPVLKRSEFLATLTADKDCVAVAGTHGKTTTTAMIAWMLTALGQDPSYIVGGVIKNLNSNAHAGQGRQFVIEADEYDRMFLGLAARIAVVTNVEHDHPDCYPTPGEYAQAFVDFAGRMPPGGQLLACADDSGARELAGKLASQGLVPLSYGLQGGEFRATDARPNQRGGFDFTFTTPGGQAETVALQVAGLHNVVNATAALAVADLLNLNLADAAGALGQYSGAGRRFDLLGEAAEVVVVSDYAHHPTEIRATLAAARARFDGRRIWAVWQPHTYSRTRALQSEFAAAFGDADQVLVTEIYAAREDTQGYSAEQVVTALRQTRNAPAVQFAAGLHEATALLLKQLAPGDVMIVLSAGNAEQVASDVLRALQNRKN